MSTLLEYGADVHQLDNQFRSPLLVSLLGDNKGKKFLNNHISHILILSFISFHLEFGEDWENFVLGLIDSGSDLLEVSPDDGSTLLHLGVHHQIIVERILSHTERIKDRFDKEGKISLYFGH